MSKPERKKLEGTVTGVYFNTSAIQPKATVMKITVENGEILALFKEKIEMYQRIQEGDYIITEAYYGPNTFKGKTTYQYTLADRDTITVQGELDPKNPTNPTEEKMAYDEVKASQDATNYTAVEGPKTADLIGTYNKINDLVVPKELTISISLSKNYQKVETSMIVDISNAKGEISVVFDAIYYKLYEQVRKKIETVAHDMR